MQTTYNCVDNIRFWLLAFKNKHNFLLFFLNWAIVGFILVFLILTFLKFCSEGDLTLSLGRKIAEYTNPSNTLYSSLSSYFVAFLWKTGLLILAFKWDIYGRVFRVTCSIIRISVFHSYGTLCSNICITLVTQIWSWQSNFKLPYILIGRILTA